eukprot:s2869_g14.t1
MRTFFTKKKVDDHQSSEDLTSAVRMAMDLGFVAADVLRPAQAPRAQRLAASVRRDGGNFSVGNRFSHWAKSGAWMEDFLATEVVNG